MATKIRNKPKLFTVPAFPQPPAEYSSSYMFNKDLVLRLYLQGVDEALKSALQYDSDDIIDGSIPNSKLENSTVSFGGVTLALGESDATPAFNLSDATGYPTSSLVGTITNAQLAGSIENAKLSNSTVSYGGVQLSLGGTDATPAFNLSDATNYPTSSLSGTITNAQLAGSITNAKLVNDSVSYGGVSLDLGQTDATPAFDLSDATNYPTSSLSGTITNAQLAGSITNAKLVNDSVSYGGVSLDLGQSDATPAFDLSDATNYPTSSLSGTIATAQIADDAVTSAKITGPFSSKHAFSTLSTQTISTTSAVTIYEPDIPAPAGGNEATQSLNAAVRVRFYNSSSSAVKENHQWKMPVAIKSKTNVGTSLGTATYSSNPSPYNAWYYVSGDKTSIFATNRGGFSTNTTGANNGSFAGVYYDGANDRTYFRASKYPDATTVYNGVEVFYSTVNFASSGTFVNNSNFNNNYLTIGSTTAYQTIEFPLVFTFGRSTTATEVRIQFDHVSSTTDLSTVITGITGYVENTV